MSLHPVKQLSASMYLTLRHNKVANIIYQNITMKTSPEKRQQIQEFYANDSVEVCWDKKIKTLTPLQHNKPGIVLWTKHDKNCFIIDVSVYLDVNVIKNIDKT